MKYNKVLSVLILFFLLVFLVRPSYANFKSILETDKSLIKQILEILFSGNGTPSDTTGGNNSESSIPSDFDSLGLPSPDPTAVDDLLSRLENNEDATWAATELLQAEKDLIAKGQPVIQYLTTAWIWFESGGQWPDPYLQNCNDSYGSLNINFTCPDRYFRPGDSERKTSLLQVGGYQMQDRVNDYPQMFNICHSGADLTQLIAEVYDNSNRASRPIWDYHNANYSSFVNQYLWGGAGQFPGGLDLEDDVYSSDVLGNAQAQARMVLLGKDPCMVIGLNSKAVTQGFLTQLNNASDANLLYTYIGDDEKQRISNMMAALYQFDTGNSFNATNNPPPNQNNPSLTQEGQYSDQVINVVHQNCTSEGVGVVTWSNYSCLNPLANPPVSMNASGIGELKSSAISFNHVQCVGCAVAMAWARERPYSGSGNAKQHIGQRVSGYTYYTNTSSNLRNLVPGSLGISNDGTYGHIWYISEVYDYDLNGSPDAYKAFECNYGKPGYMRHDLVRVVNSSYLSGWQKPNSVVTNNSL